MGSEFRLDGCCALITGAARRVGREIALALARRGMNVAVHYHRSRSEAEELSEFLRTALGVQARAFKADLEDVGALRALVRGVARAFGRIDALINNASIYEKTPLARVTPRDWQRHMDANLRAPFFLAQAAAPHLRRARGHIVNIADWAGLRPYPSYIPYCASKAGLLSLNASLAKALAPEVRVNAVMPGPVLLPESFSKAERSQVARATLLKRIGTPQDVARAVVFLLESGDFMTGAAIPVDGGRLIA